MKRHLVGTVLLGCVFGSTLGGIDKVRPRQLDIHIGPDGTDDVSVRYLSRSQRTLIWQLLKVDAMHTIFII